MNESFGTATRHPQIGGKGLERILKQAPLISLLAVLWVTCFSGLSNFALFDLVDEGFYSTISRQMLERGDWITPQAGAQIFLGKPPLFYWLQALFIKILGPTVLAARLPSALAVAGTSLVLWFWMKRRGEERTGWLAAIFYSFCPLAIGLSHVAMTDALFTLWLTVALIGAVDGYCGRRSGYLLMALGAGLATMTKGPIGLFLPGATLFLCLLWRSGLGELRQPIFLLALLIVLALNLPWHLAVWHIHGDYFLREYFWQSLFQRAIGRAYGHIQPFWSYAVVLFVGCFPILIFVPLSWWNEIKRLWRKSTGYEFTAIWALWIPLVLIFFSLSKSKLPSYILPVLPAIALFAAIRICFLIRKHRGLKRTEVVLAALCGVPMALGLLFCAILGLSWRGQPSPLPYLAKLLSGTIGKQPVPSDALVWYRLSPFILLAPETLLSGLLILTFVVLIVLWRQNIVKVIGATAALSLAGAVIFANFAMPAWSRFDIEPIWQLAETTRPSLEQGQPLVLYEIHPQRTSVRYRLGHTDLITETTDLPVLLAVVEKYPRGYILTRTGQALPSNLQSATVERVAGIWVLWRFER
jgi:4-amino-4-deoxy-L-arabinose transferase-like glycosyltransferase